MQQTTTKFQKTNHKKRILIKTKILYCILNVLAYPSNLTIGQEDSQHIVYGYLNRVLDLHCSVVHGIPNGKLMWMVHNQTLEEKTTASLVYSFKPKQQDHLQNYTCATKSDIAQYYMERTVQLFVFSKYL